MATETPPIEIKPVDTPPAGAKSAAQPISSEQLNKELAKPIERREPAGKPDLGPPPAEVVGRGKIPDPMEAMRKRMEEKKAQPEAKTPEAAPPPPKAAEVKKPDPAPADDTEVPIEQRQVLPHDKPDTAKRIKYFLRENARLAKEVEAAKAAAAKAPTPANLEEVTKLREEHAKANEELVKWRHRYEVDNDPQFKAKYDEPVVQAEATIEAVLKQRNFSEGTLKAIKDAGGFAAFSRSSNTYNVVEKDAETGEDKTVAVTAAQLARNWLNTLPLADAELIRQSLGKQQLLGEEKKHATEKAVSEAKQFTEARQAEQTKQQQALAADQEAKAKAYSDWVKETEGSTEWMKDREIPATATPEQKAEIESHNEFNKQLRARLVAHPKNTAEYQAIMLDAAEAHHMRRESGKQAERIKQLEAELARVKGGTRTTAKGGSLLVTGGEKADEKLPAGTSPTDFKTGLRRSMERRQAGGAND